MKEVIQTMAVTLDNYSVRLVGTVGNDFFGEQLLEYN